MRPCAGAGSRPQLRPSQPARANDFVVVRLFEPCGPQPPVAEARKRAPQAAPDIPYEADASKSSVLHSPRHPFQRSLFTPATGNRNSATGALGDAGIRSWYWASSSYADGNNNGASLRISETEDRPLHNANRSGGYSVRCVQASAGNIRKGELCPRKRIKSERLD